MDAIVAVDRDYGIGRQGGMLFHLKGDLQYFKRLTLGKTLVMGRATLESLKGGKPLPGRESIVLSAREGYTVEGAKVVKNLEELAEAIRDLPPERVMLIGGGQLYRLLIDCCDTAYVTHIEESGQADTFFPNLDTRDHWEAELCGEETEENGLRYRFCVYRNNRVLPLEALIAKEKGRM